MAIIATKKHADASVQSATKKSIPTEEVVDEVVEPAAKSAVKFDLLAHLNAPEEIDSAVLGVAHTLSSHGKELWVANWNGVSMFIHTREGVPMPDIVLGKKADCRVSWPRHGGYKAERDADGNVTVSIFATAVELA